MTHKRFINTCSVVKTPSAGNTNEDTINASLACSNVYLANAQAKTIWNLASVTNFYEAFTAYDTAVLRNHYMVINSVRYKIEDARHWNPTPNRDGFNHLLLQRVT